MFHPQPQIVIAAVAILLSISAHAQTNNVKTLQKQLKLWQPIEIKKVIMS
jgi:hypothetical protein